MKSNIEFLYEELRKATDGGSESMTHDDALKQIAYWRDKCSQAQAVEPISPWQDRIQNKHPASDPEYWPDELIAKYARAEVDDLRREVGRLQSEAEQAQAVEPVGYLNLASVKLPGEKHLACEFSYERNNNAAAAIPLYTHPAPPPATGERAVEPESQWPTKAAIDALKRFEETCSDGEGYDVPKDAMRALQAVGLVYRTRGNVYATTDFGNRVLAGRFFNHPAPPVEQAQAVEPVATVQCINGVTIGYLDVMQPVGTKLYTHPVPPPAGERAELIAGIKHELAEFAHNKTLETLLLDAADMLEADVSLINEGNKAQQVAVPAREPLTFEQIDAIENKVYMNTTHKGRPMFEYVNAIIRAVEAHHSIGAKLVTKQDSRPQNCGTGHCSCIDCPYPKPDWSAA